ncbi:MAG: transporter [Oligoflexia bacterium]|nr:transporter [Oligoflexia bacterium]
MTLISVVASVGRAEMESTTVLPQGVWSPEINIGMVSGLEDRFNSNGLVESATAKYHIDLSGSRIGRLYPEVKTLVSALNTVSPGLGDALTRGGLDFEASPFIQYFGPSLSYGLSKNISIGFGVPVFAVQNDVRIAVKGPSNLNSAAGLVNQIDPELDEAFRKVTEMAAAVDEAVQQLLVSRGYQRVRNLKYSALGDVQVSGVFAYYHRPQWRLAIRPFVILPTGRADDPDDLVDIATGGQTAVGVYSIHDYIPHRKWTISTSIGYQVPLPDRSDVRVPIDNQDVLPAANRKETVERQLGNTIFLEAGVKHEINKEFALTGYYGFTQKDPDRFSGEHDWNYSLLSRDTGSEAHSVKGSVEFSTINWFREKIYDFPFIVGYSFSTNLMAKNTPVATINQLYMRLFF